MAKVKIATDWLAGCAGCHMSFLDIDERIVKLAGSGGIHLEPGDGPETSARKKA